VKFGSVPVDEALGGIAAHSVKAGATFIRKGTRLGADEIARLKAAGVREIVAARLDPGDVHEDEAAQRLAAAIAGPLATPERPFTGRSNLHAEKAGVLVVDRATIDALNRIDPALTVATLPEYAVVEPGQMVATVKIIPFAAPASALAKAEKLARAMPPVRVAAFSPKSVGVVSTMLPSLKPSVMEKTRALLEKRLAPAGAEVSEERRVQHDTEAVADALKALKEAGNDLLVVFGASAVVDARDVIPAGIVAAGGAVRQLGMPVDPGNLLVLGDLDGTPVIGAPGCARSPKENGFDWVLDRYLAGLDVSWEDITGMGVGGLLMEIESRPQPRATPSGGEKRIAAVILAAGESRRMGGPNKLLAKVREKPLVGIAAEAALRSRAKPVVVVTGHNADAIRGALDKAAVRFVHNPAYADGLSTSLRAGISSLGPEIDGAVVLLADMPRVTAAMIDRLIEAFQPEEGAAIIVPTVKGKRGNPVLWARKYFADLANARGDTGGRDLIAANRIAVREVEIGEAAAVDLDTPEALKAEGGVFAKG
jgi:molybdenum cofactor cytidylyltransferase